MAILISLENHCSAFCAKCARIATSIWDLVYNPKIHGLSFSLLRVKWCFWDPFGLRCKPAQCRINERIRTQQGHCFWRNVLNYPNDPKGCQNDFTKPQGNIIKHLACEYLQRYINATFYAMLGLLHVKATVENHHHPKGVFSTSYIGCIWSP